MTIKLADLKPRVVIGVNIDAPVNKRDRGNRQKWSREYYLKNRRRIIARASKWNKEHAEQVRENKRKSYAASKVK